MEHFLNPFFLHHLRAFASIEDLGYPLPPYPNLEKIGVRWWSGCKIRVLEELDTKIRKTKDLDLATLSCGLSASVIILRLGCGRQGQMSQGEAVRSCGYYFREWNSLRLMGLRRELFWREGRLFSSGWYSVTLRICWAVLF